MAEKNQEDVVSKKHRSCSQVWVVTIDEFVGSVIIWRDTGRKKKNNYFVSESYRVWPRIEINMCKCSDCFKKSTFVSKCISVKGVLRCEVVRIQFIL